MAVEIRYVGNRGDNQWSSINYNCAQQQRLHVIRGENLVANGFLNEFKLAMANLAANNAVGRREPRRLVRLLRLRHRHEPAADLPGVPQRQHGCHQSGRLRRTPSTTWANSTIAGRLVAPNPNPNAAAGRSRRQPDAPEPAPARSDYPANFFVVNPDVNNVNVTDSGAFSDYHALQLELRRRLSNGLLGQRQLPVRVRGRVGVRRLQLRPRVMTHRTGERPPRDQDAVGLDAARSAAASGSAAT